MPNATVRQLLATKDPVIHSIIGNTSVAEAVSIMNDNRIGALIVLTRSTGKLGGIFTERDVLTRIVAPGTRPRLNLGQGRYDELRPCHLSRSDGGTRHGSHD